MCVKSIIDGEIDLAQVIGIEASTKIIHPVDLEEVIKQYKTSYWEEDPDKAEEIARDIYNNKVFYQPRVQYNYYVCGVRPLWLVIEKDNGDWFDNNSKLIRKPDLQLD